MTEAEWLVATQPEPMLEYLKGPASVENREMWGRIVPITTYPEKRISERKARLFAVACCRHLSDLYDLPHCQRLIDYGLRTEAFEGRALVVPSADCCLRAIELIERAADEPISAGDLKTLVESAETLHSLGRDYAASHDSSDDYQHLLVASGGIAFAIHHACSDYPTRHSVFGQELGAFDSLHLVVWNTAQAASWRKGLDHTEGGDSGNRAVNAELLRDVAGNPFRPVSFDPTWRTSTVASVAQGIYDDKAFDRLPILADALQDAGCENADILSHCRSDGPHVRGCWVVDLVLGKS